MQRGMAAAGLKPRARGRGEDMEGRLGTRVDRLGNGAEKTERGGSRCM